MTTCEQFHEPGIRGVEFHLGASGITIPQSGNHGDGEKLALVVRHQFSVEQPTTDGGGGDVCPNGVTVGICVVPHPCGGLDAGAGQVDGLSHGVFLRVGEGHEAKTPANAGVIEGFGLQMRKASLKPPANAGEHLLLVQSCRNSY